MNIHIDGYSLRAMPVLRADGNLVVVNASTADGRRLFVVWEKDGFGHVVVDELHNDESDVVWAAVEMQMVASKLWS